MWNWRYKKKAIENIEIFEEEDLTVQEFIYDFSLVKLSGIDPQSSIGKDGYKEKGQIDDRFDNQFQLLKKKQQKTTEDKSRSSS